MDRLLHLTARLQSHLERGAAPPRARQRAAVAIALRPGEEDPEVLLMTRAEREGDRWSGQVSLPPG